jgi:hypothetical protein
MLMALCPSKLDAISSASAVHCKGASKDPQAGLATGEQLRSIASLQIDKLSSSRLDDPKLRGNDRERRWPLASGLGSSSSMKVFRTTLATLLLEKPTKHPGSCFGGGMLSASATRHQVRSCTGQL